MPSGIWLYSYFALWLLLLLQSLLLVALIRQVGALHTYWVKNDPEWGLPLGALAPALPAVDAYDDPVSFGTERGKITLLCFLSTGCPGCRDLLARVNTLSQIKDLELVLIVGANKVKTHLYIAKFWRVEKPPVAVIADSSGQLTNAYKVSAVPYTVAVNEDGRIAGKGSVVTLGELGILVDQARQLRDGQQGTNRIELQGLPVDSEGEAASHPALT